MSAVPSRRSPGRAAKALIGAALAALLAASVALAAGTGDFVEPPTSPEDVGDGPWSVAIGDLGFGADPELAVANATSGDVTILAGDGTGDFIEIISSPEDVGDLPQSVAIGDFNGDSNRDLAVANEESDDVTILLGDGTLDFEPAATSPELAGTEPQSVAIGDFNGDSNPDLAVANQDQNNVTGDVTILLGDGSGDFDPAATSPEGAGDDPISIAVGHLDGDSNLDLAVVNFQGDVTILLGDGTGDFEPASTSPEGVGDAALSVAIGDLNGDSNPDLAVANGLTDDVTILLGDGSGDFEPAATSPEDVGNNPKSVAVGDLNGDSNPDLAVANLSDNVTILIGDGTGDFEPAATSPEGAGDGPQSVALGDLDGDSNPDLAVANFSTDDVTILLGVPASADLSLTKSDSADPVTIGESFTYTLELANAGPQEATDVVVTDTLPGEVAYDDAGSDARCDETAPGSGEVVCDVGTLASGGDDSVTIAVDATDEADPATNTASVDATEEDPTPADNEASEQTTIRAIADLTVTKSDSADPVTIGDGFTYTLELANAGPQEATGVTLTDTLPAEVAYDDAGSDARCDETAPGSGEVVCDLGTLASGGDDSVTIAVSATDEADPATNTASVDATEEDPDPASNEASEQTTIRVPVCAGKPATIVGTPGPDVLSGTPGPDVIAGRGSDDRIRGRGGDDRVCGGEGDNDLRGGDGDDRIRARRGTDTVSGGPGDDAARSGRGKDLLRGGPGGDLLNGRHGNDELLGGPGSDELLGRKGDDELGGGPGTDRCRDGLGHDSVRGCEL